MRLPVSGVIWSDEYRRERELFLSTFADLELRLMAIEDRLGDGRELEKYKPAGDPTDGARIAYVPGNGGPDLAVTFAIEPYGSEAKVLLLRLNVFHRLPQIAKK